MELCPMCSMEIPPNLFNRHITVVHKHDPNFRVRCKHAGCEQTFTKCSSYHQHLWRNHGQNPGDVEMDNDPAYNEDDGQMDVNVDIPLGNDGIAPIPPPNAPLSPFEKLKFQSALFIGTLKESLLIPQSTVQKVIDEVSQLIEDYLDIVKDSILTQRNDDDNILAQSIRDGFSECKPKDIFNLCKSPYQIDLFLKNSLNFVPPEKVCIGEVEKWTPAGQVKTEKYYAYVVPFLKDLELLLNNHDVLHCIDNPRQSCEGILKTVTDGEYYRTHDVVRKDPKTLAIMVYYDDVEFTNPLGSKTRKLAMFYWVLLNIYPEVRSALRIHNLIAICSTKTLKQFGVSPILQPFINDMKRLGQDAGVVLCIKGVERVFHGIVNVIAGDTPASALLGGFKEGVGGAARPCRTCLVKKEEVKSEFNVRSIVKRTSELHQEHLNAILTDGLTPRAKTFWSKHYGVKSKSCFIDIGNCDVTVCLPHDFMHTVLEGVLAAHITYFLRYCLAEEKFTLTEFNTALVNFKYGLFSKDKPSTVEASHLQNGIRQNAIQMLTLGQTLPFIIGRWLDESMEEHLGVFILLMQVVNVALAFQLHSEDADLLNMMIQIHHMRFKDLYGDDGITPKWHYMLHLPEQILLFGLPRQYWCMRLEALHSYFKNVARRNKNFINLPMTFATRKQKLKCIQLTHMPGATGRAFLSYGDVISPGENKLLQNYVHQNILLPFFERDHDPIQFHETRVMITAKMQVNGVIFKRNDVIFIGFKDDFPLFGTISKIAVCAEKKIVIYSEMKTDYYECKLNAYKVSTVEPSSFAAFSIEAETLCHPLPFFNHDSSDYVILTYHRRTEFMG